MSLFLEFLFFFKQLMRGMFLSMHRFTRFNGAQCILRPLDRNILHTIYKQLTQPNATD